MVIKEADKVFITLADNSTNTLSDASSYSLTIDDSTVDSAIFSKADLSINGSGSLTVNGNYKHSIVSKDDLIITGGTINVNSKSSEIDGKDCVKIKSASVTVDSGTDSIRSTNIDETDARGFVYINSGSFKLTSTNEAVQAASMLRIDGGDFEIITGGTILVSEPENSGNGALDYNTSATITGGTLIALGSSGMAQSITGEGQCTIMTDITSKSADTMFTLCDSNSNVIASFKPAKQYTSAVVSSPSIKTGESYKIVCGGTIDGADENGYSDSGTLTSGTEITEITMSEENYSSGGGSMHGGGMRGGHGGMPPR